MRQILRCNTSAGGCLCWRALSYLPTEEGKSGLLVITYLHPGNKQTKRDNLRASAFRNRLIYQYVGESLSNIRNLTIYCEKSLTGQARFHIVRSLKRP